MSSTKAERTISKSRSVCCAAEGGGVHVGLHETADAGSGPVAQVGLGKSTSNLFRDRAPGSNRRLDVSSLHHVLEVDPQQEWAEMFDNAWRLERDLFFSPVMNGQDWQAVLGIGMACAVTALPILVLFLDQLGLLRQPLGQRILQGLRERRRRLNGRG